MRRKRAEIIKVDVERNHRDRGRLVLTPAPRFNLKIAGVLAVLMIALSGAVVFMLVGGKGEVVLPPPPSRQILQVFGSNPNDPAWTIDVIGDENFRILSDSTVRMLIDSNGNVGIGTTGPSSLLSVGSTSQFQVDSSGAIVATTGITSSGTINTTNVIPSVDVIDNLGSSTNRWLKVWTDNLSVAENITVGGTVDGVDVSTLPYGDISYYRQIGQTIGRFYSSPVTGDAITAATLAASTIYCMPFICPKQITIDNIAIRVTTLKALAGGRLGIYNDNGNCAPGTLLLDAGFVSHATVGIKSVAINKTLAPGLYWLALGENSTAAVVINGFAATGLIPILGYDNALTSLQSPGFGYSFTWTFSATTLPSTPPGTATILTAVPLPTIWVRLSA